MPYLSISAEILGERVRRISVTHESSIILLVVQEDKTELSAKDPKPQIIAGAVVAFQMNNRSRAWVGLEKRDRMSILVVTMLGTWPIFYIIPVTQELSTAVARGKYPKHLTDVSKCVVGEKRRLSEGVEKPDFRSEALKHYTLFRQLAISLWLESVTA